MELAETRAVMAAPTLMLVCPVCRSDSADTLGVAGGGEGEPDASVIMRCEACESVYLTPPRSPQSASQERESQRISSASQLRRWTRGRADAARTARITSSGELPASGSYDCIALDFALERARDPGEMLGAAAKLLSPDGRIFVIAGNARSSCFAVFGGRHWSGYASGGVRQQLTARSITQLCAATNLHASRVSSRFAATAWLDSARSWLRDWGAGSGLAAVLAGRWPVPVIVAGALEAFAVLRGRGTVLVAELVRA